MASLNPISGPLGVQKATHLLRRATMGPNLQQISDFSSMNAQAAFQALIVPQPEPDLPIDLIRNTLIFMGSD